LRKVLSRSYLRSRWERLMIDVSDMGDESNVVHAGNNEDYAWVSSNAN